MRREEFGGGSDAICFEKSSVGLEPTAESGERNARSCGELGFGITVHRGFVSCSQNRPLAFEERFAVRSQTVTR